MSTSVGTAPQPTQKWKRGPLESVLPVAVMFTAMACFMLPLWYLFVASSKNRGDLTTTPGLWFSHFQLGTNVSDTVNRDGGIFWRWLLNSVLLQKVWMNGFHLLHLGTPALFLVISWHLT